MYFTRIKNNLLHDQNQRYINSYKNYPQNSKPPFTKQIHYENGHESVQCVMQAPGIHKCIYVRKSCMVQFIPALILFHLFIVNLFRYCIHVYIYAHRSHNVDVKKSGAIPCMRNQKTPRKTSIAVLPDIQCICKDDKYRSQTIIVQQKNEWGYEAGYCSKIVSDPGDRCLFFNVVVVFSSTYFRFPLGETKLIGD